MMSLYMTQNLSNHPTGRHTRNIRNYELVVPHRIDADGRLVSFHLPQFFRHNFRRKRDCQRNDAVHYNVFFNGREHHVELLPNQGFVAPSIAREFHYAGAEWTLKARRIATESPILCHFTGRVRHVNDSRVALSTCDGLVSVTAINFSFDRPFALLTRSVTFKSPTRGRS